ncbi:MAG: hypothetical protein MJZ20_03345 [Bacteroidaceae bacterium]|nr:hypothetical protein [Bacteroidaceae bacterium]
MDSKYYNQLIDVLLMKPKGLKLSVIAVTLYNMNTGLFAESGLYEKIYKQLKPFLYRESKKRGSIFRRIPNKWGYYSIKPHYARQLKLSFHR